MAFDVKKDPTRVMVLATGQGWQLAPRESNAMIYALNDFVETQTYGVKPDILFMADSLDEKPGIVSNWQKLGDTIAKINAMKVRFIGPYRYEEIPLSEAFPLQKCVEMFGIPYFTNTICYMVAYALMQPETKEIEVFGVNQAGSHEYTEERGGVEAWLAFAIGRGIKVTINGKDSQLFKHKGRYGNGLMYGYGLSYEDIVVMNKKYGETIIKRLVKPLQNVARTMRAFKAK